MKSAASIAGHPLHPTLIVIPAGGFLLTLILDIVHLVTGNDLWWEATRPVLLVSVIGALVAAIPGLVDLVTVVPKGRATLTGILHMVTNLVVVGVFAINAWQRWEIGPGSPIEGTPGIVWSILGVALLAVSGSLGWSLVQTWHVGVLEQHEEGALPQDRRVEEPVAPHRERGAARTGLTEGEITAH